MTEKKHLNEVIPEKIIKRLGNEKCLQCSHKLQRENVIAIGIRENEDRHNMFVETLCPNCSYRALTKFNNDENQTIEDMCCLLLREIHNKKMLEKAKKIQANSVSQMANTPISDEELEKCVKILKNLNTHDEFLDLINARKSKPSND